MDVLFATTPVADPRKFAIINIPFQPHCIGSLVPIPLAT